MKVHEIRQAFVDYFSSKGHSHVPSSGLIPGNDPTLLFTNAGMVQFKDVFTGREHRDYKRAVTVQKCVRAGGKHNDLENVGFTARHHTFFEMLGNFSFGDYFKEDAIAFAWEFVTKRLNIPVAKLHVTVYKTDDEAFDIWHKKIGVPVDKIYRLGEKDNFWAMGDTGPCGPCTEIFVDRGPRFQGEPTGDGDRYMEIWNLVFMQYERNASGELSPLPNKSVDTGAGLERIASFLQDVDTNYETDIFVDIMTNTARLAGKPYQPGTPDSFFFRVIADHARATTFLMSDGVFPGNEGRGYVLRRIMRRAIRYGQKLGFKEPFFNKVCLFVIDQMKAAYPELETKRGLVEKAVRAEEEQFLRTLERGLSLLDDEMSLTKDRLLSGAVAFKLYDTYGFPLDLTRIICEENNISVDEPGFNTAMEQQRTQSRKNWKGSGEEGIASAFHEVNEELKLEKQLPEFLGYDQLEISEAKCVAILVPHADKSVERTLSWSASAASDTGTIMAVFSATPFYAESGGQVGDRGIIEGLGFKAEVLDAQKPVGDLIVLTLKPITGELMVGRNYRQATNSALRMATARNHTATHLLHWALRHVLGDHVKQAGSLVDANGLRFDFSHFQALATDELRRIEDTVNQVIWQAVPVAKRIMSKDQAIASGAIAFFGEKYGDAVRVVSVGDVSIELCGGTHVNNSSDIQMFKILSESSIAAGVRRIIATTAEPAFRHLTGQELELNSILDKLKVQNRKDLDGRLEKLLAAERDLKKWQDAARVQQIMNESESLVAQAKIVKTGSIIVGMCEADESGVKKLRDIAERIKQKQPQAAIVLGLIERENNKAHLLAAIGKDAPKTWKASEIIQCAAPHIEGRGGGKPDMAQAGGVKISGIKDALKAAETWLEQHS